MRKRIGIVSARLHHPRPRGVHRLARALAEYLAYSDAAGEFEIVCLVERIENQYEISFLVCDLNEWLARHPLAAAKPPRPSRILSPLLKSLRQGIKRAVKKVLTPVLPPIVFPFVLLAYRLALWTLFWWLLLPYRQWQRWKTRPLATPKKDRFLEYTPITLNELDLVFSLESHEEIWRLPVENYPVKVVGWFYDAITKRVAEEARWNLDHWETDVSTFVLKADRIVCGSYDAEKDLHTFYPHSRGKTCVIYNGHDVKRFQVAPDEAVLRKTWRRLGINPNLPYAIAVGGLEARKNSVNVLRACVHLRKRRPDLEFQLVLVGEVHQWPDFPHKLADARRHLPVHALGYAPDAEVPILVAGAKVLLYPSLWEGFGIPPLEAMSTGTLAITSDLSSMKEVCGPHALYCDPYDPASIALALERSLEMPPDERERWTREARSYAAQFTWDKRGEELIEVFRQELGYSEANGSRAGRFAGAAIPQNKKEIETPWTAES